MIRAITAGTFLTVLVACSSSTAPPSDPAAVARISQTISSQASLLRDVCLPLMRPASMEQTRSTLSARGFERIRTGQVFRSFRQLEVWASPKSQFQVSISDNRSSFAPSGNERLCAVTRANDRGVSYGDGNRLVGTVRQAVGTVARSYAQQTGQSVRTSPASLASGLSGDGNADFYVGSGGNEVIFDTQPRPPAMYVRR